MSAQGTFACVFDCMDGRCQELVGEWTRTNFNIDYPDTITIAGLDGVLLENKAEQQRTLVMAKISAEKHGSKRAVVVGHSSCAGFVTDADGHRAAIKESSELVKNWGLFEEVVGLFVDVEAKAVEEVCRV